MWPIGGKLSFLAISTTDGFKLSNALWNNENPTNSVEFDVTAENCTQNDILFAGKYDVASKQENGNVDMTFKHAQAWLTFRLTGDETEGNESIVHFKRIELEQAYNAGKLLIRRNENDVMAEWNLNSNTAGKVTVDNKRTTKVEDLTMTAQQLDMLVPQQQNCAFTLYYTLGSDPVENSYRFELPSGTWFMGQHYIYNIHITATEITVVPSVEPWGENRYTTLNSEKLSMKAIGEATMGKLMVNGEEYDPMKLYNENDTLTIKAEAANADEYFRWEDSATIKTNDLKMTAKEFNEMEDPMKVLFYTGKVIPFAFTVGAGEDEEDGTDDDEKVYFASGNLYATATATDTTFAFEEKQYYFRTRPEQGCCLNGVTYSTTEGTPKNTSGMFQWDVTKAVKGGDFGAFGKKTSITDSDVLDFGQAMGDNWAALSKAELTELLSKKIAWSTVNSVNGFVLKPDSFKGTAIPGEYNWDTNPSGLVFLPAAGCFSVGSVDDVGGSGSYWSSSAYNSVIAYSLGFYDGDSGVYDSDRTEGYSVRLVWRAE